MALPASLLSVLTGIHPLVSTAGLSQKDAQVLKKVRKRAHRLDKAINLCGFRIGVSFFLGLIPVLGDLLNMIRE